MSNINFAYFGTPEFSVTVLQELAGAGFTPRVVVTAPDKPQGRDLVITPPPVKVWADKESIPVIQPDSLKTPEFLAELKKYEPETGWDVFIVASYGKIIPEEILNIPSHKTLNVHPSLLPKLRGASPIQSAILQENETGVSIMRLDAEVDHGPIVAQKKVFIPDWPVSAPVLENLLAHEGGELLAETLEPWKEGKIKEVEQDHSKATHSVKIKKDDGLINLSDDPHINFRKIKAYAGWPNAYFHVTKNLPSQDGKKIRVIIKDAEFQDGKLIITRIVPEGKQEMNYADFMRSLT
jgi:methionyl-tRNA formyltransferase